MQIDVKDQIPVELIRQMQHAIGWAENRVSGTKNRVMYAYRNRFIISPNNIWESAVFFGLAEKTNLNKDGYVCYSLTQSGLEFLGDLCGIKIILEY